MTTAMQIAYQVWGDLGKIEAFEEFVATGGSTTTVVNGKIADRAERAEDNYSIDYTAIVVRDSGGSSAAPEGEMQRISSYVGSTYTHTVDTAFSAAVASGDFVAIANSDIPLREMYRGINNALIKIGDIALPDTSLTSAANQTEYTLPIELNTPDDLLGVEYQGTTSDANDNQWIPIYNYRVVPASSTTATLIIPQLPSGRTIRLFYMGVHPTVTAATTTIYGIHKSVLIPAVTKAVLRWYNGTSEGGSNYWMQKENEAAQDLEEALRRNPIWMPNRTPKYSKLYMPKPVDRPPSPISG